MRRRLKLAIVTFIFGLCVRSAASAAVVGSWSKTCYAPNWITGESEAVTETNVNDPYKTFYGFTSRQPGGHWLTQYNLARIGTQTPPDVLIFLFYHECAHARFNTSSEAIADCQGLKAMNEDIGVTSRIVAEIRETYASVGRPFPSGPCSEVGRPQSNNDETVQSGGFCGALEKAIRSARSNFASLKGISRGDNVYVSNLLIPGATRCTIIDGLLCRMTDDIDAVANAVNSCVKPHGWTRDDNVFDPPGSDSAYPHVSVAVRQRSGYVALHVDYQ
jgi:hypothetical protein